MRCSKFRSTSAANSRRAASGSVDGHIDVHPWRSQRPAWLHFNHSASAWKWIHRDHPFLSPVRYIGARFAYVRHDPHRHGLTGVLAIDESEGTLRAVSPVDRDFIDEGSVLVADRPTMRNQVLEDIYVDDA